MTTDRTDAVLASIDGALADDEWPDAMRWSPEPEQVTDAGPLPYDGAIVPQPPQQYEPLPIGRRWAHDPQAVVARTRLLGHAPDCGWQQHALNGPGSCACGYLDRVATALVAPRPGVGFLAAGLAEAELVEHARRQLDLMFGPGADDALDKLRRIAEQAVQSIGEAMAALRPVFDSAADSMRSLLDSAREAGMLPDEGPTEPRARALWLRQHRGTGPQVARAQAARRPRRHT